MSKENVLKTRHIQKHDIEANWTKAGNAENPFIPLQGEIIVYDDRYIDSDGREVLVDFRVRYKIGDGIHNINALPFVNDGADQGFIWAADDTISGTIHGYYKPGDAIYIPKTHNGVEVTRISSFYYNTEGGSEGATDWPAGVKIFIPDTITYIEDLAFFNDDHSNNTEFYCEGLTPSEGWDDRWNVINDYNPETGATGYDNYAKVHWGVSRFTPLTDSVGENSIAQNDAIAVGKNSSAFGENQCIVNPDGTYKYSVTITKGFDADTQTEIVETYDITGAEGSTGNNTGDLTPVEQPVEEQLYQDGETQILSNYNIEFNTTGAIGDFSHVEGYNNLANGHTTHVEGAGNFAGGNLTHVEGNYNIALGFQSHAEGMKNTTKGQASHVEGMRNTTYGKNSHAEGLKCATTDVAYNAHVEGEENLIGGVSSHGEGKKNVIYGNIVERDDNGNIIIEEGASSYTILTSRGNYSHVEGFGNKIYAEYAHAEGRGNIVEITAERAHAEGDNNTAIGKASHVEGGQTKATGERSHTEGSKTTSTGFASHAEGSNYKADGSQAPIRNIEVDGTTIEVIGSNAYGHSSHAEGSQSLAYGFASHAQGSETKAIGAYSHAEGRLTQAIGERSHAEGNTTEARGNYSHTEGTQTIATKNNQHVQGIFNVEDTSSAGYAHIVGNGTSSKRSNAHTLDWDGNAWFKGKVYIGCAEEGVNKDASSKELATTDLVTETNNGLMSSTDKGKLNAIENGAQVNVQSDWNATADTGGASYIKNKPPIKKGEGTESLREGSGTEAIGAYSHAEGRLTKAYGGRSHTEGTSAKAYGYSSHAEGEGTEAHGWATHVSGVYNEVPTADQNLTNEQTTNTKGTYLQVVGNGTSSVRSNAYTLDWSGNAWYSGDITLGKDKNKVATEIYVDNAKLEAINQDVVVLAEAQKYADNKIKETIDTLDISCEQSDWNEIDSASDAYILNKPSITSGTGKDSIQEGNGTEAIGEYSHAEGRLAKAYGYRSHAEGTSAKAYGYSSHASGEGTEAYGWCTYVSGKYNLTPDADKQIGTNATVKGTYIQVVGNGDSATARSNAYTLDWNGNAWFAGAVTIGADKKKLATEEYVDARISEIGGSGGTSVTAISIQKINEYFA